MARKKSHAAAAAVDVKLVRGMQCSSGMPMSQAMQRTSAVSWGNAGSMGNQGMGDDSTTLSLAIQVLKVSQASWTHSLRRLKDPPPFSGAVGVRYSITFRCMDTVWDPSTRTYRTRSGLSVDSVTTRGEAV